MNRSRCLSIYREYHLYQHLIIYCVAVSNNWQITYKCSLPSQVLLLLAVVAAAYADKPQTGYGVPVGVQLFSPSCEWCLCVV